MGPSATFKPTTGVAHRDTDDEVHVVANPSFCKAPIMPHGVKPIPSLSPQRSRIASSRNGSLLGRVLLFRPARRAQGQAWAEAGEPTGSAPFCSLSRGPHEALLKSPRVAADSRCRGSAQPGRAAWAHFVLCVDLFRRPRSLSLASGQQPGRPFTSQQVAEQWGAHAGHWSPMAEQTGGRRGTSSALRHVQGGAGVAGDGGFLLSRWGEGVRPAQRGRGATENPMSGPQTLLWPPHPQDTAKTQRCAEVFSNDGGAGGQACWPLPRKPSPEDTWPAAQDWGRGAGALALRAVYREAIPQTKGDKIVSRSRFMPLLPSDSRGHSSSLEAEGPSKSWRLGASVHRLPRPAR